MEIINKLSMYLDYPFVRYALIVGILISLCSSLLGVTLVLKRYSLIGDSLSHVAFCVMAIASIFKFFNKMILVLPVTIIFAILMLRKGSKSKINGDSLVAMISVGSLSFGYLFMNLFSSSSNLAADVCTTLWGSTSILTLTLTDVLVSIILSIVVIVIFILLYNKIFSLTFDEDFAKASGVQTKLYNLLIATMIATIIVLAMNLVGSLLISALIIFPALSAMRVFKTFKSVTIFSAIFSVFCAFVGLIVSIIYGTPVGSTIVAVDTIGFVICYIIGKFK